MTELTNEEIRLTSLSHGAGCACKLPLESLDKLMISLAGDFAPSVGDLLVGAADGDDAAVLRLDDSTALVVTTDFFTPIVDDARDWGRVAAANALSDVYAMGGRPIVALNLAAWPAGRLPMELLADVLKGGAEIAAAGGCLVVGGHTIDDPEPKFGMAVVGLAHPDRLLTVDRACDGDALILTKPVGTGVVATAHKRGHASADAVAAAVASMTVLNAGASEAALAADVIAATDVTGYGLLGHLHRMLRASGVSAQIYADQVPVLPGAMELAEAGFVSGGTRANMSYLADVVEIGPGVAPALAVLLHDAQTSGGMLLAVPADRVSGLDADLRGRGLAPCIIGQVTSGPSGRTLVSAAPSR